MSATREHAKGLLHGCEDRDSKVIRRYHNDPLRAPSQLTHGSRAFGR